MKPLSFLLTIFVIKQCFCDETVEVDIKQGKLLGQVEKTFNKKQDYISFRGIPFAESPIGELRFKPPKPHKGWDGTLEANNNKPTCMQFSTRGRLHEPAGISGSEDCLYINIFTPKIEGKAPVIVFDYNDNFRTWFNGSDAYSPDFFIEEGVIVVTIANRLGIFGYLTTEDEVIPGNNGLKDYILGLEWIKSNIEQFGGDPSKVTLMGSRGGAAIADILMYSEKAKGLFSGAILQSGTALEALYFIENPKTQAFQLAEYLNFTVSNSNELLEELSRFDSANMLSAELGIIVNMRDENQATRFPFTPIVEHNTDDAVITTLPEDGKYVNDVPVIIGFNSREGLDLSSHFLFEPKLLKNDDEDHLVNLPIRTNFRFESGSTKYKEANKAIVEFYFKDKSLHYGSLLEYSTYIGDYLQIYPLNKAAEKLSKELSSPVYFYIFDFRGSLNQNFELLAKHVRFALGNNGATIIDELCYLFFCPRITKNYENLTKLTSEQPETKVMKKMIRLWSNFAKTRNPTPTKDDPVLKNFVWEPFDATQEKYALLSKFPKMRSYPLGERKKFWDDFLEKYSKEAVDGVVKGDEDEVEVVKDVEEIEVGEEEIRDEL